MGEQKLLDSQRNAKAQVEARIMEAKRKEKEIADAAQKKMEAEYEVARQAAFNEMENLAEQTPLANTTAAAQQVPSQNVTVTAAQQAPAVNATTAAAQQAPVANVTATAVRQTPTVNVTAQAQ